jgi:hypothetical protein
MINHILHKIIKMKSLQIALILFAILIGNNLFAQTKEYTEQLGKALNEIYADLPNNCKNLCGKESEKFKNSFESKVKFPNSTNNQIDIGSYMDFPVIFYSHAEADDDNAIALIKQNEISKAILATTIKYKNKDYKIIYLALESKNGDMPEYKYKLENGPKELEDVKTFVRKGNTFRNEAYKYHFEMGLYRKLETNKKTETPAKVEVKKNVKKEKIVNQTPFEKFNDLVNSSIGFEWEMDNKKARKINGKMEGTELVLKFGDENDIILNKQNLDELNTKGTTMLDIGNGLESFKLIDSRTSLHFKAKTIICESKNSEIYIINDVQSPFVLSIKTTSYNFKFDTF